MNNNLDLDEYAKWLPLVGTKDIEEAQLPSSFIQRLQRIRGVYDYWLQFPNKQMIDIVSYEEQMFGIQKTQAYQDIRLVKLLLGDIESSTKEFWRWRINTIIMDNIKSARRASDFRSVASLVKNLILNNKTDKDDPLELDFEKIVPQTFEMTDDISIVIPGKQKTSRKKIEEMLKKYGKKDGTKIQDADFEEIKDGEG
jgi:hypothetical protein